MCRRCRRRGKSRWAQSRAGALVRARLLRSRRCQRHRRPLVPRSQLLQRPRRPRPRLALAEQVRSYQCSAPLLQQLGLRSERREASLASRPRPWSSLHPPCLWAALRARSGQASRRLHPLQLDHRISHRPLPRLLRRFPLFQRGFAVLRALLLPQWRVFRFQARRQARFRSGLPRCRPTPLPHQSRRHRPCQEPRAA